FDPGAAVSENESSLSTETRCCRESLHIGRSKCGYQQPKTRDLGGERIEVHTGDRIQASPCLFCRPQTLRTSPPPPLQPSEAAEEEVARPASRIDHRHALMPEFPDRRLQCPVEDPGLYEFWGLQQGIALACLL